MISKILECIEDVSLSKREGKFLSDKAYGFDTIFFITRFILANQVNLRFNSQKLRKSVISYIEDIFRLKKGTPGAINYFNETLNLLVFSNVIAKENSSGEFRIINKEILEYTASSPEQAYIFLYLVTYVTFKNDDLLKYFEEYCETSSIDKKNRAVISVYDIMQNKSISIGQRNTVWSKLMVKYALIVLGYVNKQNYISRNLKLHERIINVKDIALNVSGTRTPIYLPKKNDYLDTFNYNYIAHNLRNYIVKKNLKYDISSVAISDTFSKELADVKLLMLSKPINADDSEYEQFVKNEIKARNPAIQRKFRKALFDNNEHCCTVCNFKFEDFLIASHIKSYCECEDSYDAVNHYNGLLMCPNHDKAFGEAKHMTINYRTGEIILSNRAKNSEEYGNLFGKRIDKSYINCERRHYLEWHNHEFERIHNIEISFKKNEE